MSARALKIAALGAAIWYFFFRKAGSASASMKSVGPAFDMLPEDQKAFADLLLKERIILLNGEVWEVGARATQDGIPMLIVTHTDSRDSKYLPVSALQDGVKGRTTEHGAIVIDL